MKCNFQTSNFRCTEKAVLFHYYPPTKERGDEIFLKRCYFHQLENRPEFEISEEEAKTYEILEE
jgi:hypothetical protein